MIEKLRRDWRTLWKSRPGRRFQAYYESRHAAASNRLGRVLNLALGLLLSATGLFFLPAPGPGMLILLLGAGMIARESLFMARLLDGAEVRGRRLLAAGARLWARSSVLGRTLIALIVVAVGGGLGFLAWWTWV